MSPLLSPPRLERVSIRRRSALLVTAALLALASQGGVASAHSELLQSTPADGEQLSAPPAQIELVFGENVQQQGGAIVVKGPDGVRRDRPATFTTDQNVATVQLLDGGQTAAADTVGRYSVAYRVVSADGHIVSGSFGYEVLAASATPSSTPSTLPAAPTGGGADDDSSSGFIWVLGLGAIGLVLLTAVVAVAVRGRRGQG